MDKDDVVVPESKKIFEGLPAKDKPDMVDSDGISLFDLHDDMKTVDAIPIEPLNLKVKEESSKNLLNQVADEAPDQAPGAVPLNKNGPRS